MKILKSLRRDREIEIKIRLMTATFGISALGTEGQPTETGYCRNRGATSQKSVQASERSQVQNVLAELPIIMISEGRVPRVFICFASC